MDRWCLVGSQHGPFRRPHLLVAFCRIENDAEWTLDWLFESLRNCGEPRSLVFVDREIAGERR